MGHIYCVSPLRVTLGRRTQTQTQVTPRWTGRALISLVLYGRTQPSSPVQYEERKPPQRHRALVAYARPGDHHFSARGEGHKGTAYPCSSHEHVPDAL